MDTNVELKRSPVLTDIREAFLNSGFRFPVLIALSLCAISMAATASTCTPGPTDPSVTVCTPTQNLIVPTPTHVQASTTDTQHKVTAVQIYVDNVLITQV